jgi:hypothetical protein
MECSPSWDTKRFSASQEIPCISWNIMVHHHVHNSPQLIQPDESSPHPFSIRSKNIILPSTLGVPSSFFEGFPHMDWMDLLFSLVQATRPANLILHNLITLPLDNHLAHHCALSCSLLLFPLLVPNIFLSACLLQELAYWGGVIKM